MPDFSKPQQPQEGILLTGSSPKLIYTNHLLGLCRNYFETARAGENVDRATAALIAFYPEENGQNILWKKYIEEKNRLENANDGDATFTASCMTIGKMVVMLSESLEFTEKSTGGFL